MHAFRLKNRRWFPWLFVGLAVTIMIAAKWLFPDDLPIETVVTVLGTTGGFVGFLYSQHSHQTQLFKELFTEFNKRYDSLNARLNEIRSQKDHDLKKEDRDVLFDYFNLCAEEHLFYRAGYIDHDVWLSWCKGMSFFYEHEPIKALWDDELDSGSYYGFSLKACLSNEQ